jgi:hypothetical protein
MKLVWEAKRKRSKDDFMEESKLKRGWKVAQGALADEFLLYMSFCL